MIKEYIEVLDNLRPEEVRFDFDPLNKNLCFCGPGGGSGDPLENLLDAPANVRDNLLSGLGVGSSDSSSSSSDVETEGGLSPQDQEMKDLLYGKIKGMFDKPYTPYEGDMYQPREQGELDLLEKLKGGGGYQELYDKASGKLDTVESDLGFASDIYKDATGYDVGRLDKDAADLMGAGSTYRNAVADDVMRRMNMGASMSGMDLTAKAHGLGAFGGDRGDVTRGLSNQNYLSAAGEQLGNMNMAAYNNALNRGRQLNIDRQTAAGNYANTRMNYGNTALKNLGIGTGGLDKRYSTSLDAFGQDRAFGDRGLDYKKKMWDEKLNYPLKQLAFGSGLYSGMPFEDKVTSSQPASGGK